MQYGQQRREGEEHMAEQADEQKNDQAATQAPATYYGTARMQQMSGGTTSDSAPPAGDANSAYGAARIAQMHGVGSDPAAEPAPSTDEQQP